MHCSSISLSIAIASVAVLFVGVDAHDENPASLSSWGLSSININHNNDKFAPSEETAIVAPANSALIIADSPPSCSANQKRNSKVRRNLSCKPEDRKSTAPTGQHSEPGQESNDPNVNKIPNEAASNSFTTVDYADFIRDKDLCPVAFVGFQRMFAVCDHGSLMSRVILQDIIVLFDVTPVPFGLGCPGTSTQWCCEDVDYWSNNRNPLQGLADNSLRETNLFFQQLPAQRPGTMWGFDCLAVPGPGLGF